MDIIAKSAQCAANARCDEDVVAFEGRGVRYAFAASFALHLREDFTLPLQRVVSCLPAPRHQPWVVAVALVAEENSGHAMK